MADGGKHFNNGDVKTFCSTNNVNHITTAAYAPWCNGLIEGANKLLLGRLRRLCAPDMDEHVDDDTSIDPESIPASWPLHLDEAIRQLNDRIRPAIRRTPRELLFGITITPEREHTTESIAETTPESADINFALADMLRMEAHLHQLEDAERQKSVWDSKIKAIEFKIGDLVQFYNSKPDDSYKAINKLLPRWSLPHIIIDKSLNSYSLSTIHGTAIPGSFHSRRLRHYFPLRGTDLDTTHNRTTQNGHANDPDIDDAEERMAENADSLLSSQD
jgi:hypothetical protein